jgi:hypothetical protein
MEWAQLHTLKQEGLISETEFEKRKQEILTKYVKEGAEKRRQIQETEFNYSLSLANNMLGSLTNNMEQLFQAGYLRQKKWFRTYKAMAVAQTIIDTYAASMKAYRELPYPINMVASGLAIATGMARLAVIKAQRFHTGGYVDRPEFNKKQMGGLRDDEIPAILQKGEYVLSRKDVEMIKSVSNPNVNVTATAPAPEVIVLNNVDESMIEEYLTSRQGREVIHNIIGR